MLQSHSSLSENILILLAAMVVSDDHIHEREIQSFVDNARRMERKLRHVGKTSDEALRHWFEVNQKRISKKLSGQDAETFIIDTLKSLEPFASKNILMTCLMSISASDAVIHRREVDMINIIKSYWNTPLA